MEVTLEGKIYWYIRSVCRYEKERNDNRKFSSLNPGNKFKSLKQYIVQQTEKKKIASFPTYKKIIKLKTEKLEAS